MYYPANMYPYQNPYYTNQPQSHFSGTNGYYPASYDAHRFSMTPPFWGRNQTDFGPQPFVVNINDAAKENNTYRTALWTGNHLQVTLMSLQVGEDIGLEIHPNIDQFLRIEQGQGIVQMGESPEKLNFVRQVFDNSAIMVPAGTWHNVTNTGNIPLKLYSIYAPPQHPRGTVQVTKAEAMAAEHH
ncbi:cupin domain-containing protein [Neobacillus mesonae]|uniref:cupin domain-containing protein n=1 Tax=Neobacillus mesonae TaxID=1193713 RepID=UPI0020426804|nr:cupin domain-containing protein [Neobacillus mesonae]MCM3570175.1 cupin domain-containing protein [Neobacillus mesonae]